MSKHTHSYTLTHTYDCAHLYTLTSPTHTHSHSHYWVIAMKVGESFNLDQDPTLSFPDNSSFTTYSTSIPVDTPYIVAEITVSRLPSSFILGDGNGTRALNDFPNRYHNGPLEEGTQYAVFVWGFSPAVPVSGD